MLSEADRFSIAYTEANAWRGHCLSHFARMERVVTAALLELARQGSSPSLPHLAGQRLVMLEEALKSRASASEAALFQRFRAHDRLRTFLAHGTAEITIDRAGRWHAQFEQMTPRHGEIEHGFLTIRARDAEQIRQLVQADAQRLEALIRRMILPTDNSTAGSTPPVLRIGSVLQPTG